MNSVAEEWRPVKGFEGKYEISTLGRFKSLPRLVVRSRGKPFMSKERILPGNVSVNGPGYKTVNINGRNTYVHAIVLETFVGPRPPKHEACHCNGIRTDNRLENLRWDTQSANQRDRAKHGTSNRGEQCASNILKASEVLEIYNSKEPGCELARRYGVAQQTICGIRKGRTWTHLTMAAG